MKKNHDIVEVKGVIHVTREKAYWFRPEDSELPVWLPRSQCEWDADEMTMQMPEWLAQEKGFI